VKEQHRVQRPRACFDNIMIQLLQLRKRLNSFVQIGCNGEYL
jgi:hypothetical protein